MTSTNKQEKEKDEFKEKLNQIEDGDRRETIDNF